MSDEQRVRGVLASLLRDSSTGRDETSSLVDAAAKVVGATVDRWSRGAPVRRFVGGYAHDLLTSPGQWVALEAKLGLAGKLGGRASFTLDGETIVELPLPDDAELRATVRAPGPGRYRVGVELDSGAPVVHGLLQVSADKPVILVDVALLVDASDAGARALAATLHGLIAAELELAYFDLHDKDRGTQVRARINHLGLPRAALLGYAAQGQTPEHFGLDLARLFGLTVVLRLRGEGVPVCGLLTRRFTDCAEVLAPVRILDPVAAAEVLADGSVERMRLDTVAFLAARAAADPLSWRLDQTTGARLVGGNVAAIELDNHRARTRLLELIEGARSSIHIQAYILRASAVAEELVVALIRQARAGVEVRLMVDALYSEQEVFGRINPLLRSLEAEARIDVLALSPIETRREIELTRLKQRDHRKLVIVDGERAIVSGRNFADEYYRGFDEVPIHDHTAHERIPWLDAHVELAGPIVTEVQRCFLDTWTGEGGPAPASPEALSPKLAPVGELAARFVVHHGLTDANGLAMYETLLALAEDHVYILNDFPIVSTLERAILGLLSRGVRVCLLTGNAAARRADGSLFPAPVYRTLFEHMVKARLEPLMLAGVEVYEFATAPQACVVARGGLVRPYVHAKLMSVDGRVCSVGSANLDATASFWESEANIVIEDREFTARLEADLDALIAGSLRLDPHSEYWQRERAQRAVVGTLWPGQLYS